MGLSRHEIDKDTLQQSAEATAAAAASVTAIVFGAVRQVITEVGSLATELFEIHDAGARAKQDGEEAGDEPADHATPGRTSEAGTEAGAGTGTNTGTDTGTGDAGKEPT